MDNKKRYLILENGRIFEGEPFGADVSCTGELVFTTGMCGYIETITDPSYFGQIVMQTFPLIGNYGMMESDFEGKCTLKGYVVREWCPTPSNFRAECTVDEFLKKNGVPGICGLDTREITKIIRESGVMNAMISDSVPDTLDKIKEYSIKDAVNSVTSHESAYYPRTNVSDDNVTYNVTLIDYGAKANIVRELNLRGCNVTCVPAGTTAEEILKNSPDGIMLSNGPGDPSENVEQISEIKKLLGKKPIFGICLGHQLLACAAGGKTVKLKYGHRGANQPVRETCGKRTYITSQNHGYAVDSETINGGQISFVNANDGTCEGVDYPEYRSFSVQFHPEACSGPHDTSFLFDKFINLMGGEN